MSAQASRLAIGLRSRNAGCSVGSAGTFADHQNRGAGFATVDDGLGCGALEAKWTTLESGNGLSQSLQGPGVRRQSARRRDGDGHVRIYRCRASPDRVWGDDRGCDDGAGRQGPPGGDPVHRCVEQHRVDPAIGPEGQQALDRTCRVGRGRHGISGLSSRTGSLLAGSRRGVSRKSRGRACSVQKPCRSCSQAS